jgi:serine O-acetyltransferase
MQYPYSKINSLNLFDIKSIKMSKADTIQKIAQLKTGLCINYSIKTKVEAFTEKLFYTLFDSKAELDESISELEFMFHSIIKLSCQNTEKECFVIWGQFLDTLPEILEKLNLDAKYILENDPASNSIDEVYLAYPGFYAIAIYRLSHELYLLKQLLFSRLMSEYAHKITGTDIHAGADIDAPFFIDHATGIVIGETCVIEKHVKIYQGVTLGALSVSKDMKDAKRHPTVQSEVCIYANATILGGETVIGKNSIVGGNAWVTKSIPERSIVLNTTTTEVKIKEIK